ncbi:MAG: hypothetical protein PVS3B2_13000 [Candidatus Dormibacteraceae bacterium]
MAATGITARATIAETKEIQRFIPTPSRIAPRLTNPNELFAQKPEYVPTRAIEVAPVALLS